VKDKIMNRKVAFTLAALLPITGLFGGCQRWAPVPEGYHNHDGHWLGEAELSNNGAYADHNVDTTHVHLRDTAIHPDHSLHLGGDVRKPPSSGIRESGDRFTERDVFPSRFEDDGAHLSAE